MAVPAPGEPAPAFRARANDGKILESDQLAGCFTTLCFFGSGGAAPYADMLRTIAASSDVFDGQNQRLLAISIDPDDETDESLPAGSDAVRLIWDFEQKVSRLFGVAKPEEGEGAGVSFQPMTVLMDPGLRVLAVHKIDDPASHPEKLLAFLRALPKAGAQRPAQPQAPVLLVPMVFEVEFCRQLIAHFEDVGGQASGILADEGGKTILTFDPERKRRQDVVVSDDALRTGAQARIRRRLIPEIKKAFQFDITRIERGVVAKYEAGDFHGLHRDNNARGTAHRQFAISIPLSAEAHSGGLLRFPEYGPQVYPIPSGCALVHSCSLLHELTPVDQGVRYAFIPVVYNEAAAEVREASRAALGPGVSPDRREIAPEPE